MKTSRSKTTRWVTSAVAALTLGMGGVALTAAPAAASTPCTVLTASGYYPNGGVSWVEVNNRCSGPIRVRVLWDWGHDSSCTTLQFGETRRFGADNSFASYDDVVYC
ncbi:hypothetical protein [Streptomyces sp. NPDC059874]|uniref:hypothetical protein n=1 Tax=Streptomyces sp. NPDC059874 TaxID=3346983 RepID=UPI00366319B4